MATKHKGKMLNARDDADLDEAIRDAKEVTFDNAMTAARRWYYGRVRSIGDELLKEIKTGRIKSQEGLDRALEESAGDNEVTIYTGQALMAVAVSDNGDAYEDDIGEKPSDPTTACAYAMVADVRQYIEAVGYELGDD